MAPTITQIKDKYAEVEKKYKALADYCENNRSIMIRERWTDFYKSFHDQYWVPLKNACEGNALQLACEKRPFKADSYREKIMGNAEDCEMLIEEEMRICGCPMKEENGTSSHSDRRDSSSNALSLAQSHRFRTTFSPRQRVIYSNMLSPGRRRS